MSLPPRFVATLCAVLVALTVVAPVYAGGTSGVAALQVALRARNLYAGSVDGVLGPGTVSAVRKLQRRAGVVVDGQPGPKTRKALGRYGKHALGGRPLTRGATGWDVAQLQFLLSWHGFPSGSIDGGYGPRLEQAVRSYQRWAGLQADGAAGGATIASLLRTPVPKSPIKLAWPLQAPVGDPFGPRGGRFHAGVDLVAESGRGVAAAGAGRVAWAGWRDGGWGYMVVVAHGKGVRTMYAHLSRVDVRVGERVGAGFQIGLVGSTGGSTGPHLHFEVRLRGAAIDPLTAL